MHFYFDTVIRRRFCDSLKYFPAKGTTSILSIRGHMNTKSYVNMLARIILPLIIGDDYLPRQENEFLNVPRASCPRFVTYSVQLLVW